jgi:hypothetical protein
MLMLPAEIVDLIQRAPCVPRRDQHAKLGAEDACARPPGRTATRLFKVNGLYDAIADGLCAPALKDQLLELERRQTECKRRLTAALGGLQNDGLQPTRRRLMLIRSYARASVSPGAKWPTDALVVVAATLWVANGEIPIVDIGRRARQSELDAP